MKNFQLNGSRCRSKLETSADKSRCSKSQTAAGETRQTIQHRRTEISITVQKPKQRKTKRRADPEKLKTNNVPNQSRKVRRSARHVLPEKDADSVPKLGVLRSDRARHQGLPHDLQNQAVPQLA